MHKEYIRKLLNDDCAVSLKIIGEKLPTESTNRKLTVYIKLI